MALCEARCAARRRVASSRGTQAYGDPPYRSRRPGRRTPASPAILPGSHDRRDPPHPELRRSSKSSSTSGPSTFFRARNRILGSPVLAPASHDRPGCAPTTCATTFYPRDAPRARRSGTRASSGRSTSSRPTATCGPSTTYRRRRARPPTLVKDRGTLSVADAAADGRADRGRARPHALAGGSSTARSRPALDPRGRERRRAARQPREERGPRGGDLAAASRGARDLAVHRARGVPRRAPDARDRPLRPRGDDRLLAHGRASRAAATTPEEAIERARGGRADRGPARAAARRPRRAGGRRCEAALARRPREAPRQRRGARHAARRDLHRRLAAEVPRGVRVRRPARVPTGSTRPSRSSAATARARSASCFRARGRTDGRRSWRSRR